jgi:D-inositol-3-phosphate glycosyltransferase
MNVYVRESAVALAGLGYQVDILTRATAPEQVALELSPGVTVVPLRAGAVRPLNKSALVDHVDEFVRAAVEYRVRTRARYDLVHSHYWLSALAGIELAKRWGAPHVAMFHTLGEVKNRSRLGEQEPAVRIEAERRIVGAVDRIICATSHEGSLLRSLYGAAAARLVTIPCGVDVARFRPDPAGPTLRRELGEEKVLLFAGRIEPLKGLDIVIRSLGQLDEPRPLLLIVGGDAHARPEIARLQRIAALEGVVERVRFAGSVPQHELPAYYSAADVCVVPSYYESFGMAALEAQACGTPVVAFRVGGLPDVLRDGETGYLVPWRCPEPFAEKLDLLLRNEPLRANLGRSARDWAQQFRWQAVAAQIAAVYEEMLGTGRKAAACHPARLEQSTHSRCEVA